MKRSETAITELIEPTVLAMELQLWGIDLSQRGKYSILRIYIEREEGVTITDCEKVSRQVSAILDMEDPIAGEYTLEVSSPGLDRPLFTSEQFGRFIGSAVKVRLHHPVDGRRKLNGSIENVSGDEIVLSVDGEGFRLQHTDIEKANVVF
ncbi:MAG: ribosome maturation factor RimP [Pseudomonadota bacterium]|nr:ribosome maturation factor RimP [Pseudomonadota bacterium]